MDKKRLFDYIENADNESLEFIFKVIEALESRERIFDKLIGINRTDTIELKPGINNKNIYGVVHGGAICSLIDIALGRRIFKTIGYDKKIYTLELKVNFIKATNSETLSAETKILHLGNTTIVAQCYVKDSSGDITAAAIGTFYIIQ